MLKQKELSTKNSKFSKNIFQGIKEKDISEAGKLKELTICRLTLRVMLKEFFTLKKIMPWIIILPLSSLKYVRLLTVNVITLFSGVFNVCRYDTYDNSNIRGKDKGTVTVIRFLYSP